MIAKSENYHTFMERSLAQSGTAEGSEKEPLGLYIRQRSSELGARNIAESSLRLLSWRTKRSHRWRAPGGSENKARSSSYTFTTMYICSFNKCIHKYTQKESERAQERISVTITRPSIARGAWPEIILPVCYPFFACSCTATAASGSSMTLFFVFTEIFLRSKREEKARGRAIC